MTYKVQIDEIERAATADEAAAIDLQIAQSAAKLAEQEATATAKAALLERLGITADEAALLLG